MIKCRTRQLLRKHKSEKGLLPLSMSLLKYKKGDCVVIRPRTENISNAPTRTFCGKIGKIILVQKNFYTVAIDNKKIVTSGVHLSKI